MVHDPVSVLAQVKDGTIIPDSLEAISMVHPKLYDFMKTTMLDHVTSMKDPTKIPFKVRQSMSFFMGEPIDRVFQAQSIAANQAAFAPAQKSDDQTPRPRANTQGKVTLAKRSGLNRGEMDT